MLQSVLAQLMPSLCGMRQRAGLEKKKTGICTVSIFRDEFPKSPLRILVYD